jgi:hypothetical protein
MAAPIRNDYRPKYRIFVQDIERRLARWRGPLVENRQRAERVFNILNSGTNSRKFSPWMCKFLATVSHFPRHPLALFQALLYLLESMRLRIGVLEPIGLRIATSLRRPVSAYICKGKA